MLKVYFNNVIGELVIAKANVLLFTPGKENKSGNSGILCVTNFRLSFVTSNEEHLQVS